MTELGHSTRRQHVHWVGNLTRNIKKPGRNSQAPKLRHDARARLHGQTGGLATPLHVWWLIEEIRNIIRENREKP